MAAGSHSDSVTMEDGTGVEEYESQPADGRILSLNGESSWEDEPEDRIFIHDLRDWAGG